MAGFELEFDGAWMAASGIAESLHAAGEDVRVWSHDDADARVENAPRMAPDGWTGASAPSPG